MRRHQVMWATLGFALLAGSTLVSMACRSEVEVVREVPVTIEVTREVASAVDVTREVPVTVVVTREIPMTVEVERQVPVTVEVAREVPPRVSSPENQPVTGGRLARVRERGKVICASRDNLPGFGYLDASGKNIGFDIDLCRAVAAAVLSDPQAVDIRPITPAERGPVIQSGEVDMLSRTVT